jgi:hypothetical protein
MSAECPPRPQRGPTARRRVLWAVAVAAASLLLPTGGRADVLDMTVATLLNGRADPRDGQLHTVVPVFESLSLTATFVRPYTDGIRIVFAGWGGLHWQVPSSVNWSGDIDVGYVEGGFLRGRILTRIGRQMVFGGAARNTQVDGASATFRLVRGLHVSGYAGLPVTPRFGVSRGDFVFGGRLFYRHAVGAELGLSFNQLHAAGRIARQDIALDAHYSLSAKWSLNGYALFSIPELRFAEIDLSAVWQPHADVQLWADYRRTAPDLFLPLNSVLAVFSQETRDEAGASLFARPNRRLRLTADYHSVLYPGGLGHQAGSKLTSLFGYRDHTAISLETRLRLLPDDGYLQLRGYSSHRLSPQFLATLGIDSYFVQRAINGQSYSITAHTSVAYDFRAGLRLVLTGMADVTPFVERRFEFIARLAYNVVRRFHEVRK